MYVVNKSDLTLLQFPTKYDIHNTIKNIEKYEEKYNAFAVL